MASLTRPMTASAGKRTARVVLLLIGPPGCGKGTQAERLKEALRLPSISTGEMIRAEIAAGTPLGKLAQGVTITGGLLGDDIINEMVSARVAKPDCANGFLLDGYPRSLPQGQYLSTVLERLGFPQPTVVHLDVPFELLIERTCCRRYCPQCGHNYNLKSDPTKREGLCDHCDTRLLQRADDCEATVRNRLAAYSRTTSPLIEYYASQDYHRVEASGTADDVYQQVFQRISTARQTWRGD